MKIIIHTFILLFGVILNSCGNQQSNEPNAESNTPDTVQPTEGDSISVDKNELNPKDGTKNDIGSAIIVSAFQLELNNALLDSSISAYCKEVYKKGKYIPPGSGDLESVRDSLFTTNPKTDLFYFIVFTKLMNNTDGHGYHHEALSFAAKTFVIQKTQIFADYFIRAPKLTETDLDHWADYVYGQILLGYESEEFEAMNELLLLLQKNVKDANNVEIELIENFNEKIKKHHEATFSQ